MRNKHRNLLSVALVMLCIALLAEIGRAHV